ncbi:nose resistant to fluoxetine protein 6-like [Condylostylus longicornis]|uniref:nose resistant to fluoxetine protein 6-like n=1 Tax=Condylostylus longicornis TaxID=2530218 RepID=UPI00244DEAD8|nr:nose resistant to fluoxetine protein 6-like [Condylostylus longicornis]
MCLNHIQKIEESIRNKELWAMEVIDSWGTFQTPGILYGHLFEIGNYEELIEGKYCQAEIPLENLQELIDFKSDFIDPLPKYHLIPASSGISFGICIPNSCSPDYLNSILKEFLNNLVGSKINDETNVILANSCKGNEKIIFRPIDYVAMSILGLIAFLVIVSTVYDLSFDSMKKGNGYSKILTAFSIKKNGKHLFKIQSNHDDHSNHIHIECIHGIRVLTIIWIVFLHEYTFSYGLNFINRIDYVNWSRTLYSMVIQFGNISVDTFFVISGCLLTLSAFKEMNFRNGKLNVPLMYLHRYIRLTPLVAILVLIMVSLYRYFGDGPYWNPNHIIDLCERNWWSTLLYIHNYVHPGQMCLGHSWYLAVDTQLYFISPLFLIILWKYKEYGMIPIILAIVISAGYIFEETMHFNFHMNPLEVNENDFRKQELIYYSTHSRISPFMVGIILGYYIYKYCNEKIKLYKPIVIMGWFLSILIIIAIVFGPYHRTLYQPNSETTVIEVALYESLSRLFWSIAVSWIIFACHKGYGGIINKILSFGIWQPLGRLTFSIYLNHLLIQMILTGNSKTDSNFSNLDIILEQLFNNIINIYLDSISF